MIEQKGHHVLWGEHRLISCCAQTPQAHPAKPGPARPVPHLAVGMWQLAILLPPTSCSVSPFPAVQKAGCAYLMSNKRVNDLPPTKAAQSCTGRAAPQADE